ncbi:hypothetical protein CDO52_00750 [Nocardiopsis gilva YIM 90087]|uniref:Uncharacterized protein n=1 Tax=Nocardiopsis gilva YIM 90087 TaxID=1235441 RepID=A0A223S080_9ACTN|nr:hypothetical protein [Nocardiopsis gilva]ASU81508.1 hypothetical protein CDO52_00750 [Nocardiopsis gilva YIM 90087]
MSRRSVYTNTTARATINPAAHTSTATGSSVDRNVGDDMHRTAMVVVHTGTITDGTHTIEVQDSDDDSTFTAVADAFLQGTEPEIGTADDDKLFYVGYIGVRRYLRVVSTVAGATTGGIYGASILLGEPRRGPVDHTT